LSSVGSFALNSLLLCSLTISVFTLRLTPGPGYLEALVEDNVDFISNGIKRITETGIETEDGTQREYDTIVFATGFDTSYRPRIPICEFPRLPLPVSTPSDSLLRV